MTVVIDTNVLLTCLRRASETRPIFDAVRSGEIVLAVSNDILMEYDEIIGERTTGEIAHNVIKLLLALPGTRRISSKFRFRLLSVDPDDNKFVDCAIISNAEILVSNDKHYDALSKIDFPKVKVMGDLEFRDFLLERRSPLE